MTEDKLAWLKDIHKRFHEAELIEDLPNNSDFDWMFTELREAWEQNKKLWKTIDHVCIHEDPKAVEKLREEIAEYRNVLGWYANKGHPNSEWDKSLWWQHAEKVLDKWDRTTKAEPPINFEPINNCEKCGYEYGGGGSLTLGYIATCLKCGHKEESKPISRAEEE